MINIEIERQYVFFQVKEIKNHLSESLSSTELAENSVYDFLTGLQNQ